MTATGRADELRQIIDDGVCHRQAVAAAGLHIEVNGQRHEPGHMFGLAPTPVGEHMLCDRFIRKLAGGIGWPHHLCGDRWFPTQVALIGRR